MLELSLNAQTSRRHKRPMYNTKVKKTKQYACIYVHADMHSFWFVEKILSKQGLTLTTLHINI